MLCACCRRNARQESPPTAANGRADARLAQDLPNGRGGDGQPESVDLAGDPLVVPTRVLTPEAEDEFADLAADLRLACPTGVCPGAGNQLRVPAKQRVRRHQERAQRERGSSRLVAASRSRSLGRL